MKLIPDSNPKGTDIYYMVWCDDENAPPEIKTDVSFALSEYSELEQYLEKCSDHNLKTEIMIEIWNEVKDEIPQRIYLKEVSE
ncbi:MAG TPA: hypothetical protein DEO59_04275 [Balneola sp.]|nr:hypothetical protein [Balneola sp.]